MNEVPRHPAIRFEVKQLHEPDIDGNTHVVIFHDTGEKNVVFVKAEILLDDFCDF